MNADRLWSRLQALSTFTEPGRPWTRRAFSAEFAAGRAWLAQEFAAAGLEVRTDAGGNLVGRLPGSGSGLAPIVTGSHSDTVPSGGRFDGALGVVAGLEALQSLREAGVRPRHPLEVVDFLAEEPSDHGVSCIGSRAFGGALDADMLALRDPRGETVAESIRRAGGDPQAIDRACRGPGGTAAYVELHIEQGPVLEREGLDIGVVTHIVGIRRYAVTVHGRADHAGTTPMDVRQDALAGAARVVLEARRLADGLQGGDAYVVATVGRLEVHPNAANAVAGRVELTLEVRSDSAAVLERFAPQVLEACAEDFARLRVAHEARLLSRTEPVACDHTVMGAVEEAARALRLSWRRLPSGAGHDAMQVARTGPVGMVFVPCRGGRSHCPEEWLEKEQAAAGAAVLAHALLDLDRSLSPPAVLPPSPIPPARAAAPRAAAVAHPPVKELS